MRATDIKNRLMVSVLVTVVLGAVASASAGGSVFVNVGGIDRYPTGSGGPASSETSSRIKAQGGTGYGYTPYPPEQGRPVDRTQTGAGGSTTSNPSKVVDKFPTGGGTSTGSYYSHTYGTFRAEDSYGRPGLPCSTLDLTIGEDHLSAANCPISNGTFR
jgi:hypothetical protein